MENNKKEPLIPLYDIEGQLIGNVNMKQWMEYRRKENERFEAIKPKLNNVKGTIILYGTSGSIERDSNLDKYFYTPTIIIV